MAKSSGRDNPSSRSTSKRSKTSRAGSKTDASPRSDNGQKPKVASAQTPEAPPSVPEKPKEEFQEETHPQRVSVNRQGMVATAHHRATEAGAEILAAGGNAIDAAVAAAFALSVCEPMASGLGGQTMMIIHTAENRRTVALDGSSRAPHRATPGLLMPGERRRGYRATTVPATVAVLDYARKTYGRLPLKDVLEPAIRLAKEGYQITALQHKLQKRELKHLQIGTAGKFFLQDGKTPYPVGATFRQPVLAGTLERLAAAGMEDFYAGEIAREIDADMVANDGLVRMDDLVQVPWPLARRPVSARFDNWRILTFPPPGAGRTLIQMLKILSQFPPEKQNFDTPEGAVILAETIRRAYIDRSDRPFNPNFYPQVEDKELLGEEYSKLVAKQVRSRVNTHGDTTHLSVMDKEGNVVGLTQSIERVYGSFSATSTLGFLYNNYMSAFEYKDIAHPYHLRPNAVPWASVAPTIVFRGRKPWVVLGSPGSERIAPAILQVLLRLRNQAPMDAVSAPRLFCTLKGTVHLEASRMRDDIVPELEKRGFKIRPRDPFAFYMGCVQMVMRERRTFIGVADLRRDGSAGGPRS